VGGVLVVGEALVDILVRADGAETEHPGGSPLNVAIGLSRLGRDTHLLTRIGQDERGHSVLSHLASSGVRLVEGSVLPVTTATAAATLAPDGSATYEFDLHWELGEAQLPTAPLAVHTGSIAAVLEPGAPTVEKILRDHRGQATISNDPNARPLLMGDASSARERIESLVAVSDLVKVSDEDAAWLSPGESPEELAIRWLGLGPSVVVLTNGAAGMLGLCRAGRVEVPAERVTVSDTVGAGDSAMAALLDGLWQYDLLGGSAREALTSVSTQVLEHVVRHAARAAAITVSRPGADPPTRAELGLPGGEATGDVVAGIGVRGEGS
jgi:fructokinase